MSAVTVAIPPELLGSIERYAVYRCYSDQGELLYVGETGDLGKRFADHAKKLWFVQVRGITLEWYADELEALKAERRAIHVEHPKYNVQHRNLATLQPAKPRASRPGRGRQPEPVRSWDGTRDRALQVLRDEPGISGSELGRRLGFKASYGRTLRRTVPLFGRGAASPVGREPVRRA
jgi:predicted GIY-YIG superfamily endonuclease